MKTKEEYPLEDSPWETGKRNNLMLKTNNNEEIYRETEKKLNDFKNRRITFTDFIDWAQEQISKAEKRGFDKGYEIGSTEHSN